MANVQITSGVNSVVDQMKTAMLTYGPSGEAANFDPFLKAMGSNLIADSVAMAGTSNPATESQLISKYGQDATQFTAEVQAILMSTSSIPPESTTAIANDLFGVMHGVGSQMEPVDPHAEEKLWMGVGNEIHYSPYGASSATIPGTPAGTIPGAPAGVVPGTPGATFQVSPAGLGLGIYDYYANPDPTTPAEPAAPAAPAGSVAAAPTAAAPAGTAAAVVPPAPAAPAAPAPTASAPAAPK